jgi:hypothetical protein
MTAYYSDRHGAERPRLELEFSERAWRGVVGLVQSGIARGNFAEDFPERCQDEGRAVYATDEWNLQLAVEGEHPDLSWPLRPVALPITPAILDLLEFLHTHATKPTAQRFHPYYDHHHLSFDRGVGQFEFREQINTLLSRNALAYEMRLNGRIERLLTPVVEEALRRGMPTTGDAEFDALVRRAEGKFVDRDVEARRESLEQLWDAFERAKTILDKDKKRGITAMLRTTTSVHEETQLLEADMRTLTKVGNTFHIRHHETWAVAVPAELVDYLFVRLYALLSRVAPAFKA